MVSLGNSRVSAVANFPLILDQVPKVQYLARLVFYLAVHTGNYWKNDIPCLCGEALRPTSLLHGP